MGNNLSEVMTLEQEKEYYYKVLDKIHENPRYYLDNLEILDVFKVGFIKYSYKKRKVYKRITPQ